MLPLLEFENVEHFFVAKILLILYYKLNYLYQINCIFRINF